MNIEQARAILEGLQADIEAGAAYGKGGQQVSRPPALGQVSPGARMHIERAIRHALEALGETEGGEGD